jgi:apolipoprotein D and lipocalin family protein
MPEKRISALAKVVPGTDNARWKIRFFGIINTDYLILNVDPDYRWALVGHPSRKYAWVFAREATIDEALYQDLLGRLAGFGYDPALLKRVPQLEEQQGQPGFQ